MPAMKAWSADMLLCDIVDAHPDAKGVLESFGLPCWRCVVAYHETLVEGCRPHGLDPAVVLAALETGAPLAPGRRRP